MDLKFEWIIPFIILGVMLLPRVLSGLPADSVNEIVVLLVTCILIAIVIAVLRYLRKIEQ